MPNLENLDFIETPVAKEKDYKSKIWGLFENLKILDGFDKDGEEALSACDDEEEAGPDGEGEGEMDDFIDPKELNEEDKKKLEKEGMVFAEAEGENDKENDAEVVNEKKAEGKNGDTSKVAGTKRTREDAEEGSHKRQKVEE